MRIGLWAACAALLVMGCQTTADPNSTRTMGGLNLGSAEWKTIALDDGKLAMPADTGWSVSKVQERDLPNRYQEEVQLRGGYVSLEVVHTGGFNANGNRKEFLFLHRGWTLGSEKIVPATMTEEGVNRRGDISYAAFTYKDRPCVVYSRVFGKLVFTTGESFHEAAMRGFQCGAVGEDAEQHVSRTLGSVARVKLRQR